MITPILLLGWESRYAGCMRYLALASDYDGTLAHHGIVNHETIRALERLRNSGRRLILVTGRAVTDLEQVFPQLDLFHSVVAENGALLHDPHTHERRLLAQRPRAAFVDELKKRGVNPLSVGEVVVATHHPNEGTVLDVIRDLGLELNVIFNKGSVMVLPSGVNKFTGLKAALDELGLSEHNVVGVGDAENDHALLAACECGFAVANALPAVKETADMVTAGDHGAGVVEIIDQLLADDLESRSHELKRHDIPLGVAGQKEILLPAYGSSVLIAGASGSGKSTLTAGLIESISKKGYQICLIDPEGDYDSFEGAITIGDDKNAPSGDSVIEALQKPSEQVVVNLIGLPVHNRPRFFAHLLPRLQEARLRTGRPHWIIVDEAHHMLPAEWGQTTAELPPETNNLVLITVHPEHVSAAALTGVNAIAAVGPAPQKVLDAYASAAGVSVPKFDYGDVPSRHALYWFRGQNSIELVKFAIPEGERNRHKRKYAQGELEEDAVFYFTGSRGQFRLRAQNLNTFLQLAYGLDDETWIYHLKKGDYSNWIRTGLKDQELADEIAEIEHAKHDPEESRTEIRKAIEARYTAPA